jgi:UDP-N-acetyl-D-galactosamine dehydrogenase
MGINFDMNIDIISIISQMNEVDFMDERKIAVIGLGYVGLPLAHAFSFRYEVVGFDISRERIEELGRGFDRTLELDGTALEEAKKNGLKYTDDIGDISDCDIYIVTVPTPLDRYKNPDLTPLIKASETVGSVLSRGDIVIYESTVYPGATEEVCVPVLERVSGLEYISGSEDGREGFYCGYSPERINPGDKEHTVRKILKVTSGSTPRIALEIDALYASIIEAGTHLAPSIRVAEAAKVIENSQRDINIAFVNELALIFDKLGIDTGDVLDAAGTKWNFLPFSPGLVGGHCIGVDPYYLTYKAREVGYHPEVILSGRRINDNMGSFVASKVIKLMIHKGCTIKGSRVLVLGITFKENCPDIRNSRVIDVIEELEDFGVAVDVYDPWADREEVAKNHSIDILEDGSFGLGEYDAVILAVAHREFERLDLSGIDREKCVIYDIKSFLDREKVDERL